MADTDTQTATENVPSSFRAGIVTLAGRPNVGKSTLVNTLLNQKIAAVSPKPQTTRKRQFGILTLEHAQIIFQDVPGIHQPRHKLGEYMLKQAIEALEDADVLLFLVDGSQPPHPEDEQAASCLRECEQPLFLVLNKMDLIAGKQKEKNSPFQQEYQSLVPQAKPFAVSAINADTLEPLLQEIIVHLPEHPPYYDPDQVTNWMERDIAADLIREAALLCLRDEVPHGVAVRIDEYKERGERGAYIAATIFCERESQKAIIIGRQGEMLKQIGSLARQEIEMMSGRKVFLELRVKTQKNWRNNEKALRLLGYPIPKSEKTK